MSLDEVITGLMGSRALEGVRIGYIPAGTTNDFASSLGISHDMLLAAKAAVSDEVFSCDIGRFGEDYFVYVAAFGLFTEASYSTSQDLKNLLGGAAYILEGAKQLADIPSYKMQVECDGEVIYGEFVFGMISNSISVGGIKDVFADNISLSDGLFEVTLVRMPVNPLELSEIIGFFTNFNRDTRLVESFKCGTVTISATEKVSWTLDGEYGGSVDKVHISVIPKAVDFLVDKD